MNQYDLDGFDQRIMLDHWHLKLNHVDHEICKKNWSEDEIGLWDEKQISLGCPVAINSLNEWG